MTPVSACTLMGNPVLQHIQHLVDGKIIWASAIDGSVVLTTRGGYFELTVGRPLDRLSEPFGDNRPTLFPGDLTFLMLTSEAPVVLAPETA